MDTRLTTRAAGASLTLLVQIGLIALFAATYAPRAVRQAAKETIFWLHPQPEVPRQQTPASSKTRAIPTAPKTTPAFILPTLPRASAAIAKPEPDIAGFGQMLFGCAPQDYANLPPEQKARCPKPGEGLQVRTEPDLMGQKSDVKDEAHWEREWARVHGPILLPCGGFTNLLCLLGKIADGSLDDYGSPDKWPVYAAKRLSPYDFHKIEKAYDAWHRDHPVK